MRNLEVKVRCAGADALRALAARAVAGGATFVRVMRQRDTYFIAPHGRLKLREWWTEGSADEVSSGDSTVAGDEDGVDGAAGAVLIAYARPDDPGARLSDYLLVPASDPTLLCAALGRTLGVRVVVEKWRTLYRYGRTRIHLDEVAGLGAFLELETVLEDEEAVAGAARAEYETVSAFLGLAGLPVVAGSYSDLLAPPAARR